MDKLIGVKFGDFHSYDDFGLMLSGKSISTPTPKTTTIDIPGGDGVIDLTEALGEVKYNNRTIQFDFTTVQYGSKFLELLSKIQTAIHGKKLQICLDADPDFYYFGRITVKDNKDAGGYGTISIECDCEPYKYKVRKTCFTEVLTGHSVEVNLSNSKKSVVPIITTTGTCVIAFGDRSWFVGIGEFYNPEILLTEGSNFMTLVGNCTVTIEYQEGVL